MEQYLDALERAFADYLQELEERQKKTKPTDGLLGFGRSIKDDPCHERADERVEKIIAELCALSPAPETAVLAARLLLRADGPNWPLSAQWMLRALERHVLPLVPFLAPADAAALQREYAARYKPWDRLPAQKAVYKALKARAGEGTDGGLLFPSRKE